MRAERFSGYQDLKLVEIQNRQCRTDGYWSGLTAAGVTPLDHTILSGGHPRAKAPLVLGNEGAGVIEMPATRVSRGKPRDVHRAYGVRENGAWQEWLLARPEIWRSCPMRSTT